MHAWLPLPLLSVAAQGFLICVVNTVYPVAVTRVTVKLQPPLLYLLEVAVAIPLLRVVAFVDWVAAAVPSVQVSQTMAPLTAVLVPARVTLTVAVQEYCALEPLPLLLRPESVAETARFARGEGLQEKQQA